MITEFVLLKFIFWEILCHTGYPTESLGFSQWKMDVDFHVGLPLGKVRVKKNPPSYGMLSIGKRHPTLSDRISELFVGQTLSSTIFFQILEKYRKMLRKLSFQKLKVKIEI